MNDEQIQGCCMHSGELGFSSLELPFHPASLPTSYLQHITNATEEMVPATPSVTQTPCLNNFCIPSAFILCTLVVNLADNLSHFVACSLLILTDIHHTKSFESNHVPSLHVASLNKVSVTQTIKQKISNGEQ